MKRLIIILSAVLVLLLFVCFRMVQRQDTVLTEPTQTQIQTEPSPDGTAAPTQTETEPAMPETTEQYVPETTQPEWTEPTAPTETEPAPEPEDDDFVRIVDWIPDARTELVYATADNFTGTQIYEFTDAYLRYGTVKKLAQAADLLREMGYGLVIWDGYRPTYAQQKLWDVCPDPNYVSQPGTGSQSHCRGIAVDVTLYDLETGELLEMPSGFDEFSALGDRDYSDCSGNARQNALTLETAMESCGFKPYSGEWWHFADTQSYEIEYDFDPRYGE